MFDQTVKCFSGMPGRGVWSGGVLSLLLAGQLWAQPYGLNDRPVVGAFLNGQLPPAAQSAVGWSVVEAFPNVTFDDPVCLLPEPGTNRLYICERQGKVYFFENDSGTTTKTLFLDLSAMTQGYDDCGLIGMAFHPEYRVPGSSNRGYVYIYYQFSEDPTSGPGRPPSATPGFNRLSRFTVPDGSLIADASSEQVLINQFDRHVWHNGGGMFFGPDGFLYVSNGDEGAARDTYDQSQEIDSGLFSGVLRIDVDKDPSRSHPIRRQPQSDQSPPSGWTNVTFSADYYIPDDNPWLDSNGAILEEFYAVGLRSPHRMTYDPPTGRIWLGDIGQGNREEIDIIVKGANYQWAYREGTANGFKSMPNPLIGVDTPPVYDYGRSAGDTCVIGGYVYRGLEHADALYGKYIFGDNTSGRIWSMTYDGTNAPTVVELLDTGWPNNYQGLSSFGLDNNNELYICKMGRPSKIYKLARPAGEPPAPPTLLSQTGAFADLATLAPAAGLIPYDVNSPLWSDGAAKARWVAVPTDGAPYGAGETVGFAANGEWVFPVGSVLVKHFELGVNETNPAAIKRLETRFMVHATNNTWYGLTYKWRSDHSDADLLPGGLLEDVAIQTPSTVITQVWQYPGRQDCLTCHNETANRVLGVKTRQLNGDMLYPSTGIADNQLRTWSHLGLFDITLNETNIPAYDKMVEVTNATAGLELRVRSYLDANCAHCHRPNGVAALFDTRFDTPLEQQGLVNGAVVDPLGIPGAKIIAPQSLSQSLLYQRDNTLGATQMPPLARNVIHTNYIDALAQWINSLPVPAGPPAPWSHQDVGPVGVAGKALYSSGVFTVDASGVDIWDQEDSFHFVHRVLNGDGVLTARVAGLSNTHEWAFAGVMIRQSLSADSPYAMVGGTPEHGISMTRRFTSGASSSYTAGSASGVPHWVRLERAGNTFTASESPDGVTWTLVDSVAVAMTGPVYAGLAHTSHDNAALGTSTFDNVSLIGPGVNSAPAFVGVPADVAIVEHTLLSVTNAASDVDAGDVLGYQVVNPPTGAVIDTNGVITWTPSEMQGGSTNTVTTVVDDGQVSATNSFLVTVLETNAGPTFNSVPGDIEIVELTVLSITNSASDVDVPVQALTYLLLDGPTNAVIDTNGVITWLPDEAQGPGTNSFVSTVSDGLASSTNTFIVTVTETNAAPGFDSAPVDVEMVELTLLSVTNSASDADVPEQPLTYSLLVSPTNAVIDTNGVISWTALEHQGPSTNSFTTTISDGLASSTNTFLVTVTETNAVPTFNSAPVDVEIVELTLFSVTNSATDPDVPAQALSYTLITGPTNAAIDTNGVITWTPLEHQGPGTDSFVTWVSDGEANITNTFVVTVTETNSAPAFVLTPADLELDELTLMIVTNVAMDADLPINLLTYELLAPPAGAVIDTNGIITWTPSEVQGPSTNAIVTVVSDGLASRTNSFVATVLEVNVAPTAMPDLLTRYVTQGLQAPTSSLLTNDFDADADAVIFAGVLSPTPLGASVIASNALVYYQPVFGDTNADTFSYVVGDGHGASATGQVTVSVQPDPVLSEVLGIQTGAGEFTVSFTGVPGFTYTVQYTDLMEPANWQNLAVVVADELGQVEAIDNSPGSGASRFYRAVRGTAP